MIEHVEHIYAVETMMYRSNAVRIFIGFLIIAAIGAVFAYSAFRPRDQTMSPFLARLESKARTTIQERNLKDFAVNAVKGAADLQLGNHPGTRLPNDNFAALAVFYKPSIDQISEAARMSLGQLMCDLIDCKGQYWALEAKHLDEGKVNVSIFRNELTDASEMGKACGMVDEVRALAKLEPVVIDDSLQKQSEAWIHGAETCRRFLEPEIRTLTDEIAKAGVEIQETRNQINSLLGRNSIEAANLAAPKLNLKIDHFNRMFQRYEVFCAASKALAAGYLLRTASPTLVGGQVEATALIAVAIGLGKYPLLETKGHTNYMWPQHNMRIEEKVTKEFVEEAKKTFEEQGYKMLPTQCNRFDEKTKCEPSIEKALACRNLLMLRKNDILFFAQVSPPSIVAHVSKDNVRFTKTTKETFNPNSVSALLCSTGYQHLDSMGRILIGLEIVDRDKPVYIRQTEALSAWDAEDTFTINH